MPKLLTTPFASEATSEYRTDVQNATGAEPNSATYEQGFPPLTMEKIANGGKPPKGSDLNGVLYDITDNLVSLTKGARYGFNEAYATAIGGYPLGAVLRLDNGIEVESEVDSNSINPNVDMTGWKLAVSDNGIVTWSGRTQRGKNKETPSILDFYKGEEDYSTALQRSIVEGGAVYIPSGTFICKGKVNINVPNFKIYGNGELAWADDGTVGSVCFEVTESGFECENVKHRCLTTRRLFYRIKNEDKDIEDFTFNTCKFKGGFYAVRGGLGSGSNINNTKIKNVSILNCISDAPTDVPAGHYIMSNSIGTRYIGNTATGGSNTSSFGLIRSTDFVITGNVERNVTPYQSNSAEASIQLEDCDLANGIVSSNICSHDIWISGSNNCTITDNTCRWLRVTVGNPTGYDVYKTLFKDNKCCSIQVNKYGSYDITNTYSADFEHNTIDPQFATVLGRTVPTRAYSVQGGAYGKDLNFIKNKTISSATTNQFSLIRGSILNFNAIDNDFGVGTNITSSSGGLIREYNSVTPIFPVFSWNPLADIGLSFSADKSVSTSASWVKLTGFTASRDLNSNVDVNTGAILLPVGNYKIELKLGITALTAGNTVGIRLVDQNGTEFSRLVYEKASNGLVMYSNVSDFRMTSARTTFYIEIYSDQSATVSGTTALSNISITKLS